MVVRFCQRYVDDASDVLVMLQITPAVAAALPNSGHPFLNAFADALAAGKASSVIVTLVPNW